MDTSDGLIYIQPLQRTQTEILSREEMNRLCRDLSRQFATECVVMPPMLLTEDSYDPLRDQYLASIILSNMRQEHNVSNSKVLGLVSEDLYADELNFVFGQAELGGRFAVISTSRLTVAGQNGDEGLFYNRVLTEAVHEIGHTFGLGHCPNALCVMHF
jgi:archaemetzincin